MSAINSVCETCLSLQLVIYQVLLVQVSRGLQNWAPLPRTVIGEWKCQKMPKSCSFLFREDSFRQPCWFSRVANQDEAPERRNAPSIVCHDGVSLVRRLFTNWYISWWHFSKDTCTMDTCPTDTLSNGKFQKDMFLPLQKHDNQQHWIIMSYISGTQRHI